MERLMAFASYNYLITRFDKKKVDEVSQYTTYDPFIQDYVAVTDQTLLIARANQALEDACHELRYILSCCYGDLSVLDQAILDGKTFAMLERFNAELAYHILKNQSTDCDECVKCKTKFKDICEGCNVICSIDKTVCLEKEGCFVVEEKSSCIPSMCDICCSSTCLCCPDEEEEV